MTPARSGLARSIPMLLLWAVCGSILWAVPLSAQTDIPGPLVDPALSLYTGPVSVPLEIEIPALNLTAPILGVGLTLTNAMAAPRGIRETDPLWYSVFWYRGGGFPETRARQRWQDIIMMSSDAPPFLLFWRMSLSAMSFSFAITVLDTKSRSSSTKRHAIVPKKPPIPLCLPASLGQRL